MKTCERCGGTGVAPLGSSGIGVWCHACNGRGEIGGDAVKGGETMNDEMMAHTFVVESMTVEAGRIIPSPALAEAVIGGIAQIIAERDAMLPFVRAFVEIGYAEWDGHEFECPHCGAGHREHNLEDAFLNRVQEHAEGCIWREAKFWLDANAPKGEPQP